MLGKKKKKKKEGTVLDGCGFSTKKNLDGKEFSIKGTVLDGCGFSTEENLDGKEFSTKRNCFGWLWVCKQREMSTAMGSQQRET